VQAFSTGAPPFRRAVPFHRAVFLAETKAMGGKRWETIADLSLIF